MKYIYIYIELVYWTTMKYEYTYTVYIELVNWTVMKYEIWMYTLHCIDWSIIKYLRCILYNEHITMKSIHCMLLTSTLNYSEMYTLYIEYIHWTEWIHYTNWTWWNIYTYWTCTIIGL